MESAPQVPPFCFCPSCSFRCFYGSPDKEAGTVISSSKSFPSQLCHLTSSSSRWPVPAFFFFSVSDSRDPPHQVLFPARRVIPVTGLTDDDFAQRLAVAISPPSIRTNSFSILASWTSSHSTFFLASSSASPPPPLNRQPLDLFHPLS